MTIITGWRAEEAGIDGAQVMIARNGPNTGFRPAKWYEVLDQSHGFALIEDRDREWVARELGDAPCRHTAEQWTPAELEGMNYLIEHAKRYEFNRIPDYFGETVPGESLGRDHE